VKTLIAASSRANFSKVILCLSVVIILRIHARIHDSEFELEIFCEHANSTFRVTSK